MAVFRQNVYHTRRTGLAFLHPFSCAEAGYRNVVKCPSPMASPQRFSPVFGALRHSRYHSQVLQGVIFLHTQFGLQRGRWHGWNNLDGRLFSLPPSLRLIPFTY
jgi:hypothetical protein